MRDHALKALELFSAGDLDSYMEHVGDAVYTELATGRVLSGEEFKQGLVGWRAAFPNMVGDIQSVIDSGDSVAVEIVWKGTHDGPLHTPEGEIPATGGALEGAGCIIFHYENGSLTRINHYFDMLTVLRAVGAA